MSCEQGRKKVIMKDHGEDALLCSSIGLGVLGLIIYGAWLAIAYTRGQVALLNALYHSFMGLAFISISLVLAVIFFVGAWSGGTAKVVTGLILALICGGLSIYALIRLWPDRAMLMGHYIFGTPIRGHEVFGYIVAFVFAVILFCFFSNYHAVATWFLVSIILGIMVHIFGITVFTVILSIIDVILLSIYLTVEL